jgi:hypothetical protein
MIVVVYSPKRGFFKGCEPAGFGGVEGDPEFSRDPRKAIDLAHGREVTDKEFESCRYHLGYIHPKTPDAFLMRASRKDLRDLAAVYQVMET